MLVKTYGHLRDRLGSFLEAHLTDLENEERVEALTWYCQGLGLELPHKTAAAMAQRLQPNNVESCRQRMQRGLQRGRFAHTQIFERLQTTVFEKASGRFAAYLIDDTGIAKKGEVSVGVQRQYSGTLGKIGNCQIVVSLHAAQNDFSTCLGAQLYLPKSWTEAKERLLKAKVPQDIEFQTKPQIALSLLRSAVANGAPKRPVVADAAFGDDRSFRDGIGALELDYVVAVSSNTTVWPPGSCPTRPAQTNRRGRPRTRDRDEQGKKPVRVDAMARQYLEQNRFRKVTWRNGTKGPLFGQFFAVRVHSAENRTKGQRAGSPLWLLMEREASEKSGFKFYLSSLKQSTSLRTLVWTAKLRWRIERDYQDMKQQLGLDQYEGRQWGGLHRHLAMVALVHAFLALHREDFSPGIEGDFVDLGRLSSGTPRSPHALDRTLPNLSANL